MINGLFIHYAQQQSALYLHIHIFKQILMSVDYSSVKVFCALYVYDRWFFIIMLCVYCVYTGRA